MPTAQKASDRYFAASPSRKMSSASGSTTSSNTARMRKPYFSQAELVVAAAAAPRCVSPRHQRLTLVANSPLGRKYRTTITSSRMLARAIDPLMLYSNHDCI